MNPDERYDELFREIFEANGFTYDANTRRVRNRQANSVPDLQRQLKTLIDAQEKWERSYPASFTKHVQNHWEHAVLASIQTVYSNVDPENQTRIAFLYQHYSFFKNTLANVIQKKRDRMDAETNATQVIEMYQMYKAEGTLLTEDEFVEYYAMFGTPQQWMDLCDSLQELYEGEPDAYIQQMIALTS